MNATRSSRQYINSENNTDTTATPDPTAIPIIDENMNIKHISTNIIMCPANMFAKRRIIRATGLVRVDIISITGINGIGALRNTGTSGHKTSFQYSFVPHRFVIRYVNSANTNVTDMLPVRFAPNGKIGTRPIRLFIRMKKNTVNK